MEPAYVWYMFKMWFALMVMLLIMAYYIDIKSNTNILQGVFFAIAFCWVGLIFWCWHYTLEHDKDQVKDYLSRVSYTVEKARQDGIVLKIIKKGGGE